MSVSVPTPPVPELARAKGETEEELVEWLVAYYNSPAAPFNYRRGTSAVKQAYRGLHNLPSLLMACSAEPTTAGRRANLDLVEHVAPIAFDRSTQVFDLTPRKFPFGQSRLASYRVPFFFVEDGIVKLYFLQPRKGASLSYDEICMVATIFKNYLLDTEFFGLQCGLEIVDASAPPGENARVVQRFSLAELELWSADRLARRLSKIARALQLVETGGLVSERRRAPVRPSADMPLFD